MIKAEASFPMILAIKFWWKIKMVMNLLSALKKVRKRLFAFVFLYSYFLNICRSS